MANKKAMKTVDANGVKETTPTTEQPAPTSEQPAQIKPSAAIIALFNRPLVAGGLLATLKRKNNPSIVKPCDVPVGGMVAGVIVDVLKSPVTTVKGSLLSLALVSFDPQGNPVKTDVARCLPATGVIKSALAPGAEGEEDARKAMLKYKGHLIVAIREDDKPSKKYNRSMFCWDVRVSDKPVAEDLGIEIA